jgi:FCD domain
MIMPQLVTATGYLSAFETEQGAFLERCFTTPFTGRCEWRRMVQNIQAAGAERTIITANLGQPHNPGGGWAGPDGRRMRYPGEFRGDVAMAQEGAVLDALRAATRAAGDRSPGRGTAGGDHGYARGGQVGRAHAPTVSLAQHERVVAAIAARNPDKAEAAMRDHIGSVIEVLNSL